MLRSLAEHGTVEFFDRHKRSRVEAVAIDLPQTPPVILALMNSYRGSLDTVDQVVLALLRQVPRELTLEPELRSRLDKLFALKV